MFVPYYFPYNYFSRLGNCPGQNEETCKEDENSNHCPMENVDFSCTLGEEGREYPRIMNVGGCRRWNSANNREVRRSSWQCTPCCTLDNQEYSIEFCAGREQPATRQTNMSTTIQSTTITTITSPSTNKNSISPSGSTSTSSPSSTTTTDTPTRPSEDISADDGEEPTSASRKKRQSGGNSYYNSQGYQSNPNYNTGRSRRPSRLCNEDSDGYHCPMTNVDFICTRGLNGEQFPRLMNRGQCRRWNPANEFQVRQTSWNCRPCCNDNNNSFTIENCDGE